MNIITHAKLQWIWSKTYSADENEVRIAEPDKMKFRSELWAHCATTDYWRVGRGIRFKRGKTRSARKGRIQAENSEFGKPLLLSSRNTKKMLYSSLLKGMNFKSGAAAKDRNAQIGGQTGAKRMLRAGQAFCMGTEKN